MKKEYSAPDAEWIRFSDETIIRTSGDDDEEEITKEGSLPYQPDAWAN